jgi:hypothetical protein
LEKITLDSKRQNLFGFSFLKSLLTNENSEKKPLFTVKKSTKIMTTKFRNPFFLELFLLSLIA